jgi:hypothetical protein
MARACIADVINPLISNIALSQQRVYTIAGIVIFALLLLYFRNPTLRTKLQLLTVSWPHELLTPYPGVFKLCDYSTRAAIGYIPISVTPWWSTDSLATWETYTRAL